MINNARSCDLSRAGGGLMADGSQSRSRLAAMEWSGKRMRLPVISARTRRVFLPQREGRQQSQRRHPLAARLYQSCPDPRKDKSYIATSSTSRNVGRSAESSRSALSRAQRIPCGRQARRPPYRDPVTSVSFAYSTMRNPDRRNGRAGVSSGIFRPTAAGPAAMLHR